MDPTLGLPARLVIKTLRADREGAEGFVERFKHETAVAVCVNSEHIAHVHDAGAIDDELYIAMEYVPGLPLSRVLNGLRKDKRMLSPPRAVELCSGGLLALADIHRAKDPDTGASLSIVHRDVAPKNLIVTPSERMKLIDLGIGKSVLQEWKTQTGLIVGSPGYMAPEQVSGQKIDHRIDLYAMAIVVYETLTLRTYIPRGQVMQVLAASLEPTFIPPSEIRVGVSEALDRALAKALSHRPEDRYGTAEELLDALRKAVMSSSTEEDTTRLMIQAEHDTNPEVEAFPVQKDERPATVFARRASSKVEVENDPTEVLSDSISDPDPTVPQSPRQMLRPASKPLPATKPLRSARERYRGTVLLLIGAATMLAISIGVSVARYEDGGSAPAVAPPLDPPAEAAIVPKAQSKPMPPAEPVPMPVSIKNEPRSMKVKRAPPIVAKIEPPPPPSVVDLETLEKRAVELSKQAPASDRAEIHRLLSDIAMEQASRDGADSARLQRLQQRVERLEARFGKTE
jgi:serine/threonine protein kinase